MSYDALNTPLSLSPLCFLCSRHHIRSPRDVYPNSAYAIRDILSEATENYDPLIASSNHLSFSRAGILYAYEYDLYLLLHLISVHLLNHKLVSDLMLKSNFNGRSLFIIFTIIQTNDNIMKGICHETKYINSVSRSKIFCRYRCSQKKLGRFYSK